MQINVSPILIKEMRSTMRGGRTFVGITLFLLFLSGITLLVFYTASQSPISGSAASQTGQLIFGFVGGLEALMLAAVTPTLTAGAIATERQKQTFEMLMATPLTPAQVLRGKLLASMNYLALLVMAALPINSIVFLFGGVSPQALFWWLALVSSVLLLLGALGLFMSTLFRSSGVATALTYLICLVLFVGVPLVGLFLGSFLFMEPNRGMQALLLTFGLLHPVASFAAILVNETDFNAAAILPATISFYMTLSLLLFFASEARLSRLGSYRWQRGWLVALLLVLAAAAVAALVLGPVATLVE